MRTNKINNRSSMEAPKVNIIHNLIARLEYLKLGYLQASYKTKDEVLALCLERFGFQRERYSMELQQIVNISDSKFYKSRSLIKSTGYSFLNFFFKKADVITTCIKNDEHALINYDLAIAQLVNNDEVKRVLLQQANGIKTVIKTMKEYTGKNIT